MSNIKVPVIIGALVLTAFLWGYLGDTITETIAGLFANEDTQSVETKKPIVKIKPKKRTTNAKSIYNSLRARRPAAFPSSRSQTSMSFYPQRPRSYPQGAVLTPNRPFGGTFDSVKGTGAIKNRTRKRNLYFEKLTEEMRKLRGETANKNTAKKKPPRLAVEKNQPGLQAGVNHQQHPASPNEESIEKVGEAEQDATYPEEDLPPEVEEMANPDDELVDMIEQLEEEELR